VGATPCTKVPRRTGLCKFNSTPSRPDFTRVPFWISLNFFWPPMPISTHRPSCSTIGLLPRQGKTSTARLLVVVQVPAAVPTRAEKESDPDWRRAETACRSLMRTKLKARPGAPESGVTAHLHYWSPFVWAAAAAAQSNRAPSHWSSKGTAGANTGQSDAWRASSYLPPKGSAPRGLSSRLL
jgi:hypothetical protein